MPKKATAQDIAGQMDSIIAIVGALSPLFGPQAALFIALGQIFAKIAPDIVEDIQKLLTKAEPTEEDKAKLRERIQALINFDSI